MSTAGLHAQTAHAVAFLQGYTTKINAFEAAHQAALARAAATATDRSRSVFRAGLSGRPHDRPGSGWRPTTNGRFDTHIKWAVNNGAVRFNAAPLKAKAPYYLIQEIGTGSSATAYGTTVNNGKISGSASISIKSQKGRFISPRLLWGTSLGGAPTRSFGSTGTDQLYPASLLDPSRVLNFRSSRKKIRREIKAKQYIAKGGRTGFYQYRTRMLAEKRKIFK